MADIFIEVTDTYFSGLKTGIQVVTDQIVSELSKEETVHLMITTYTGKLRNFQIPIEKYNIQRNRQRRFVLRKIYVFLSRVLNNTHLTFIKKIYKKIQNLISLAAFRKNLLNVKSEKSTERTFLFLVDAFWNNGSNTLRLVQDCREKGIQVVVFVHDILPLTNPEFFPHKSVIGFKKYFLQVVKMSNILIFTSDSVRKYFRNEFPSINSEMVVVPLEVAPRFSEQIRPKKIPPDLKFALTVGTLEPRKNYSLILRAFNELDLDLKLVIVGRRGWISNEIIELIRKMKDKVIWLPNASDGEISWLMAHAEYGICASHAEGFGLPLREFLAHGLGVIASDIPIFHEIEDGYKEFIRYFISNNLEDLKNTLTNSFSLKEIDTSLQFSEAKLDFKKNIAQVFK